MNGKKFSKCIFFGGLSGFLCLFVMLGATDPQGKEDNTLYRSSYALIIGIENYNNWPSPGKTFRDAVLVGNELEKLGFDVTYRSDLDLSNLENNLRRFFYSEKIDSDSRLFIWFSGHAHTIDGESFLVPTDAPRKGDQNFKMSAFPVRRFDELSRLTKAKWVYMVFDACLSSTVFINESNDSPAMQVASMLKYPSRQYLCSCTAGQQTHGDGAFRDMFIKALRNEDKVNANGDNYLTASEIGSFMKKEISGTTWGKNQEPQCGRLKEFKQGEFAFLLPDKSGYLTKSGYFRDRLKNGMEGPEMINIPKGSFMMGDSKGDGFNDEKPVHRVSVSEIAVSCYEVTFAEYDRYCEAKNPTNDLQKTPRMPSDNGWGRGNRPVINVSWEDSVAYTKWLSEQTGYTYRLPTEAEWEYFARAGTDTNYWWGNEIENGTANCYKCGSKSGVDAKEKTASVGSFEANNFGMYDTVGNVWEWTCSEYTDEYKGKETECLEKITTGGEAVVLRGGAWDEKPEKCRVSHRKVGYPGERSPNIGFRVVKEFN